MKLYIKFNQEGLIDTYSLFETVGYHLIETESFEDIKSNPFYYEMNIDKKGDFLGLKLRDDLEEFK
jgi:hypothetical protein